VDRRHAEDGHDRVTDELLDGASVPLEDRLRRLEAMTWRRLSGSICSPSAVDPETSQKKTVTVFRTSRPGAASARGAPQESQKCALSRFAAPQVEHTTIDTSLGRL
jgi:hypothetical protein